MTRTHRSQFLVELKELFPELRSELNVEHGLLHLETAAFRRFTQRAIDLGEEATVRTCFAIAEKYFLSGNAKLQNALGVSYVEDLEFRDQKVQRHWAWQLLPESLKREYENFHGQQHG